MHGLSVSIVLWFHGTATCGAQWRMDCGEMSNDCALKAFYLNVFTLYECTEVGGKIKENQFGSNAFNGNIFFLFHGI